MKTAGVGGGGGARALKAEETGTGWLAVLSVPATRLYCPSMGRQDRPRTIACPETHLPGQTKASRPTEVWPCSASKLSFLSASP